MDTLSPAQSVRDYFTRVLVEKYLVPQPEAEASTSKWRYGTAREVAGFDVETYRQIFGPEIGGILYGHRFSYSKKTLKDGKEFEAWQAGKAEPYQCITVSILCGVFGIAMLGLAWVIREYWFIAVVVTALGVILLMAAVGFYEKMAKGQQARAQEMAILSKKGGLQP